MPGHPPKKWIRRCIEHVSFHSPKARNAGAICASTFRKMRKSAQKALIRLEK